MKSDQAQLNTLLARLVDEVITPEEVEMLESILDKDPVAQRYYLHYIGLHEDLSEKVALSDRSHEQSAEATPSRSSARLVMLVGLVSCIILVGLCVWWLRPAPAIAEVVDYAGPVRWIQQEGDIEQEVKPEFAIQKGWIETMAADSWVKLAFPDTTEIHVSGIARLHIDSIRGQKKLRLTRGNITVDAATQPQGKPLVLNTPSAEATVLGTQFNVVASDFSTHLQVNEGLVKIRRLADGQVEEVKRDHQVVAALESDTEFTAHPRKQATSQWSSRLPGDILQGHLTEGGSVRTHTHLWRGDKKLRETLERPMLLHSVVLAPSSRGMPPLRIDSGSYLTFYGRVAEPAAINIGFTTHHPKGGFAGKYYTRQKQPAGEFEIKIPVSDFKKSRRQFPETPIGYEISHLWIQTRDVDSGLVIDRVTVE